MKFLLTRADERGRKDLGWLQSNFSFSFGSYAHPGRPGFGLLRTFNDDFVAPGKGFGIHPHANMEIISVLLAGRMNHIDSLGYKETIEAGGVQIMSAGSGLRHEEYNVGEDGVNFLQIWIEPKLQNISPRYQRRHFPESERKNQLITVVSNEEGPAHCWINQNAKLTLGYYEAAQTVEYRFNPLNKALFLFVISGSVAAAGQSVGARDSIGFWETAQVDLKCAAGTRFLLVEVPINA